MSRPYPPTTRRRRRAGSLGWATVTPTENCPISPPGNDSTRAELDAALDIGKILPDFDAAKMGTIGADGGGDPGADVTRRAEPAGNFRMDAADLLKLIHRSQIDFFLGVEAGPHRPLVEQMEQRTGLDQPDGLGVGQEVGGK